MDYGYARVSTREQNLDRQLVALREANIPDERIFQEKQSGKNFTDRVEWQRLKRILKKGDTLFIKSLDRMSRNYKEVRAEWEDMTVKRGINLVILDMPILDTRTGNGLMGTLISDIVLSLLAFVAQNERERIRERAAEGRAAAIAKGVRFGRAPKELPPTFYETVEKYLAGDLTVKACAEMTGVSTGSFCVKAKEYAKEHGITKSKRTVELTPAFYEAAKKYIAGEITMRVGAEMAGLCISTFYDHANKYAEERGILRRRSYNTFGRGILIDKEDFEMYLRGECSARWLAEKYKMSQGNFNNRAMVYATNHNLTKQPLLAVPREIPDVFFEVIEEWHAGKISHIEGARRVGIRLDTWHTWCDGWLNGTLD